ncbi:PAS domain-containing protein [Desulfopila aestuarii]|uniref:histidine kinase n=1 Tax=Desulfopila aestuarii DSM 18488 TaxID=1121416 RepID=A0A1M7YMC5_9BACT|nr:PAS domain-containing protein [Desulfopila aestuarii]SHO53779.1 PAS domain S-box-containing protein [Desulfopila aestuarii DSM 18488]
MTEMFRLITPITYWVLISLWSFILCFYVQKMWNSKTKDLFRALVIILAIDAFRTLFESVYFGLWYTSLSGLIPKQIGDFLTRPEFVIIPKIINVVAAVIIIVLLLKKWLPREEQEKNRTDAALHESEEEFKLFFENNPISCWLEDWSAVHKRFEDLREKGISNIETFLNESPEELMKFVQAIKIKDVNQASLDLHRAENKEQLLQGLEKTFTSESFECFKKELVDLWNGKNQNSCDGVVKTLDGELRYVQISYRVLPGYKDTLEKVIISVVDNTLRKQAEDARIRSEERLTLVVKGSNDAPWDWDLLTNELYYSPQWWAQLGYTPDEIQADAGLWERLIHPEDGTHVDAVFRDALKKTINSYEVEFRLLHKDGHYVPVLSRGFITRDEKNTPIRVTGTNMDLSVSAQQTPSFHIVNNLFHCGKPDHGRAQ